MNLKTEKRDIDGVQFTVTQHPPLRALPLFVRLGKAVGSALFDMMEIDLRANAKALAPIMEDVFSKLSGDEATTLVRELLLGTTAIVDGRATPLTDDNAINSVFASRLPTMFRAAAFSAEVNFANFFGGWPHGAQATTAAEGNPSG